MHSEPEEFVWELSPFRVDSYGNWISFGWPISGGWIPSVSVETSLAGDKELVLEWLCSGIIIG